MWANRGRRGGKRAARYKSKRVSTLFLGQKTISQQIAHEERSSRDSEKERHMGLGVPRTVIHQREERLSMISPRSNVHQERGKDSTREENHERSRQSDQQYKQRIVGKIDLGRRGESIGAQLHSRIGEVKPPGPFRGRVETKVRKWPGRVSNPFATFQ